MGPKTLRRLAIAAVVLVLGVVSIFLLQRYQVSRMGRSNLALADQAVKDGDLAKAEDLYLQHVQVFPEDVEAQLRYAKVLLDRSRTPGRVTQAQQIYRDVLDRQPGRDDVRRLLVEELVEGGAEVDAKNRANIRTNLSLLLRTNPDDGDLAYMKGRCEEAAGDERETKAALDSYKKAIERRSKHRFDACRRMAQIYRTKLSEPAEADRVIDEMVKNEPEDYRVYLERGRYREGLAQSEEDLGRAEADYREASRRAPQEAEPYLLISQLAASHGDLRSSPPDKAKAAEVLKQGLEAAPKSGRLYQASALLALGSGEAEEGIRILRRGLDVIPDDLSLRLILADVLARRGATVELRDQVGELTRLGVAVYPDYYMAYALANSRDWAAAKKILLDRLVTPNYNLDPRLRSAVGTLLARCYASLGDSERQLSAISGAVRDDPTNRDARLALIASKAMRGDVDGAIADYRAVLGSIPEAAVPLAQLLIERNRGLAEGRRDWTEVGPLIDQVDQLEPGSSLSAVLRSQMLLSQGLRDQAVALLKDARAKKPRDRTAPQLWIASADLLAAKNDFDGALRLLDEADGLLGDSAALRIARMRYRAAGKGRDVAAAVAAMVQGDEALPLEQRITLLEVAADQLTRIGDVAGAAAMWARHSALVPNDLRPCLEVMALAIKTPKDATPEVVARDRATIEKAVADIHRVEGPEGYLGRYAEIEFLLWQARRAGNEAERARLRGDIRGRLAELRARRPDWSVIPLATARLEEEEIAQAKDDAERERRTNRIADLYRQAVDMGQSDPSVVTAATEWMLKAHRAAEVGQLWSKVPVLNHQGERGLALERSILAKMIDAKNYDDAETVVRERIVANPDGFADRVILAQLLIWQQKIDEAIEVLRQAVAVQPTDTNRHVALVQLLVQTGRIDDAEKAYAQIERAVGPEAAPLTLAMCSDLLAQGCLAIGREDQKARWVASAKEWYGRSRAAKPADFAIRRGFVEFLLRLNLVDDAQNELLGILKSPDGVDPADRAWAKRTLALAYVSRSELAQDYQQALKALHLYVPPGQSEDVIPEETADRRVLARVYEAQKIVRYRRKAITILEKLVAEAGAAPEDRFLLARLYKADNRWDDAHKTFRDLMRDEAAPTSTQDVNGQVTRLHYYASELISHIEAGGDPQDVAEAQALIDRLKSYQPDGFPALALQARLEKATGKVDQAVARVKEIADRPQLTPALARATASLAETLGQFDMAERLLKRLATTSTRQEDQLEYAAFLGRRGRVKEGLDVCESFWKGTTNPEPIAPTVIGILLSSPTYNDATQISRVSGWVERSLQQKPDSLLLTIALATIRDREQRYGEAVELYGKALAKSRGEVIPLNNLAWLLALRGEKGQQPLEMINRAINLRGPLPELLDTRAVVYLTKGENRLAIDDLENAIALEPSASRYFHLARAQLAAGDVDSARRSLAHAQDHGLNEAEVHPLERASFAQVEKALK